MVQNSDGERSVEVQSSETMQVLKLSASQSVVLSFSSDPETNRPSRLIKLPNFSSPPHLPSPTAQFHRLAKERDEFSRSVPSPSRQQSFRARVNGALAREINWSALWKNSKGWIKNPFNMALLLWITCVAISGAILFFVMTGMLNRALPKRSQRNTWFEVNNQILNALFTLMCLYQHPRRFHHFVLLCRWKVSHVSQLRKIYCKNGTYKTNEWTHMMVVVLLLHMNCFAQYALCGLNLGYKRSERPAIGVGICLSVAIASAAIASLYSILSPLGKDYVIEVDEESQDHNMLAATSDSSLRINSREQRLTFSPRNDKREMIENKPEWRGGLLDLWDDITVAFLSLFCTFCLFGWNMERLGFGNKYVHVATFLLFCTAPFWIFDLAAVNIDNETVREALGVTGIVLCVFGLLYGGFWRVQMRKRFRLPSTSTIFGDCISWLCCCWCSLAQEVRTADYYIVIDDKFCRKQIEDCTPIRSLPLSPLPREDGVYMFNVVTELRYPSKFHQGHGNGDIEASDVDCIGSSERIKPPIQSTMARDDL